MKKALKITGIALGSLVVIVVAISLMSGVYPLGLGMHSPVYAENNVALGGYDLVSYQNNAPIPGSENHEVELKGVSYYFSSLENAQIFESNPEKYLPKYGGYCAFGVSKGFSAPGNPTFYVLKDSDLFILSNEEVLVEFKNNPEEIEKQATSNWKTE